MSILEYKNKTVEELIKDAIVSLRALDNVNIHYFEREINLVTARVYLDAALAKVQAAKDDLK